MTSTRHLNWWWHLQLLQWIQTGRANPLRRIAALLVWWLPCVVVPLVLYFSGAAAAMSGLDFLLSLDVPLTLALAAVTALDAMSIESHAPAEDWLWPHAFRPAYLRWISRLRWLLLARWPAGLALAGTLLASGASAQPELLGELLAMALLGLIGGASFAWTIQSRSPSKPRTSLPRRAHGLAALSWVAFHETRERFDLQRVSVFAVPALLTVPLGAFFDDAVKLLATWLVLVFALAVCRAAAHAQGSMHRWLHNTAGSTRRLTWWIWRHIALGIAAIAAMYLLWMGYSAHATGKPE